LARFHALVKTALNHAVVFLSLVAGAME